MIFIVNYSSKKHHVLCLNHVNQTPEVWIKQTLCVYEEEMIKIEGLSKNIEFPTNEKTRENISHMLDNL